MPPLPRNTYYALLLLFSALLLALFLYWPGLDGPFLLDDKHNITPTLPASLSWDELTRIAMSNNSGPLGRPVSIISFALNSYISGLDPRAFKYVDLMLHLLTGVLLFWLSGLLLGHRLNDALSPQAWNCAGLATLLWLIHPLLVSTVLYAVQRMAQLSTLFTVAAMLLYTIARLRIISKKNGYWLLILGLGVLIPLALLSKENGALIPFYLLLIEGLFFHLNAPTKRRRIGVMACLTLFAILPIITGILYLATHLDRISGGYVGRTFSLTERLLTETHVLLSYIQNILLPQLSSMGLFLDDFPVTKTLDLSTVFAIIALCIMTAAIFLLRRRATIIAFGCGWFLISHLMESTILPLELVFEHRNYLAAFGPLLMLACFLTDTRSPQSNYPRLRLTSAALLIALFAILTSLRVENWRSNEMMIQMSLLNHPGSPRLHTTYVNILWENRRYLAAREHIQIVEQLEPLSAGATLNLLLTYCVSPDKNQVDQIVERALDRLQNGVITIHTSNSLKMLVFEFTLLDKCPSLPLATVIDMVEVALNNPDSVNKAPHHYFLAHLLMKDNQPGLASSHFKTALPGAPLHLKVKVLHEWASSQIANGDFIAAHQTIQRLTRLGEEKLFPTEKRVNALNIELYEALKGDGEIE